MRRFTGSSSGTFHAGRLVRLRVFLSAVVLFAVGLRLAHAEPPNGPSTPASNHPSAILTEPVRVELIPDLWLLSFRTDDRINGQPISKTLYNGKILSHLQSIVLGEVVVSKGPLTFFADINYAQLDFGSPPPPLRDLSLEGLWTSLGVGYRFDLPLQIGSRPVLIRLQPSLLATQTYISVSEKGATGATAFDLDRSWWSPAAGVRGTQVWDRSSLRFGAFTDITGRSRTARQAIVGLEYALHPSLWGRPTVGIGYRYRFDQRIYADRLKLSTTLRGPVVYAASHF